MHKRTFLKSLFAVTGAIVTPTVSAATVSRPKMPREQEYLGYTYFWTGLKGHQDHAWLAGQWLAWPLRGFGQSDVPDRESLLYVSVPGFIGGPYFPGHAFNLTSRDDRWILFSTPPETVEAWIDEGERYIRFLIESYHGLPRSVAPLWLFPEAMTKT